MCVCVCRGGGCKMDILDNAVKHVKRFLLDLTTD